MKHEQVRPLLAIASSEVHVWDARISAFSNQESFFLQALDAVETDRATRFHFTRDRTHYVVAHGLLRGLLGRYVGSAPDALRFDIGRWGKPALRQRRGAIPLSYNLSHSGDMVLIAIGRGRDVGADIERWAGDIAYDEVAEFCFSAAERAELGSLVPDDKAAGFFSGWSRKEAYLKATGAGVTSGLDHFDVSLAPGATARLVADRRSPRAMGYWTMRDLEVGAGYSAAVVAAGRGWDLRRFSFTVAEWG